MKDDSEKFVICTNNDGCEDLEPLKLYQVLPDHSAIKDNYIRIIDESGEDYLYPKGNFISVNFSSSVEKDLLSLLNKQLMPKVSG